MLSKINILNNIDYGIQMMNMLWYNDFYEYNI